MLEYGSSAMSVQTTMSGKVDLIIRTALGTMPLGLYDSSARLVFKWSGTLGNKTTDLMPYLHRDRDRQQRHTRWDWLRDGSIEVEVKCEGDATQRISSV